MDSISIGRTARTSAHADKPRHLASIVDYAIERTRNLSRLRTVIALLGILEEEFLKLMHERLRCARERVAEWETIDLRIRANTAATAALISERELLALAIGPTALRAAGVRS